MSITSFVRCMGIWHH